MRKSNAISINEIKSIVGDMVEQKLIELLGDPDQNLKIRPEIKKRLVSSLKMKSKAVKISDAAKDLGLHWSNV